MSAPATQVAKLAKPELRGALIKQVSLSDYWFMFIKGLEIGILIFSLLGLPKKTIQYNTESSNCELNIIFIISIIVGNCMELRWFICSKQIILGCEQIFFYISIILIFDK